MRTLVVIACLVLPTCMVHAQGIYKWEDEKGVIHYGDKAPQPGAVPFIKDTAPFSTPEGRSEPSETKKSTRQREKRVKPQRQVVPSPSLRKPKVWVEYPSGKFWMTGTLRNSGRGLCETPTVEVAVIDELGKVDKRFELGATPNEIDAGEIAQFSGSRSAPLGNTLSWEATPRCTGAIGAIYGARKRGSVRIPHSRIVRSKKLRTR